jgi:hypothetical protein
MKSTIFWDITPCSPLSVNRRFGGTYRLHLQVRKISQQEISVKAGGKQSIQAGFLLVYFSTLKRRLTLNGLHGIMSQKMVLFEKRNDYKIVVAKSQRKRPLRTPRRRWENGIKTDLR